MEEINEVYKIVRRSTSALGGSGYAGPSYGELTQGSMQKVLQTLVDECDLTTESRFLDVGSGLGKPNLHAAVFPGVAASVGIECERLRFQLGMLNLRNVLKRRGMPVYFVNGDIEDVISLEPFTHIYMSDRAFPWRTQKEIARKFNVSHSVKILVSFRPPSLVIEEFGYEVDEVTHVRAYLHGSMEQHTIYVYKRCIGEEEEEEQEQEEIIDPKFAEALERVAEPTERLLNYASHEVFLMEMSERPVRHNKRPRRYAVDL
jgi:SAM-dependent methyltransferase